MMLWSGLWRVAVTLVLGVAAFRWGARAGPRADRRRAVAAGCGVLLAAGSGFGWWLGERWLPLLRPPIGWVDAHVADPVDFACLGALVLTGVAWCAPEVRRRGAVALAGGLAAVVLLLTQAGPLTWAVAARGTLTNRPDAQGIVCQSTHYTCGPAATAMLLARYGVHASEGEVALLARCNLVTGTDPWRLGYAVGRLAPGHTVRVRRLPAKAAERLGRPFVATVELPGFGGHAVLVEAFGPSQVALVDPLTGTRGSIPRREFEAIWRVESVWLE